MYPVDKGFVPLPSNLLPQLSFRKMTKQLEVILLFCPNTGTVYTVTIVLLVCFSL